VNAYAFVINCGKTLIFFGKLNFFPGGWMKFRSGKYGENLRSLGENNEV
jgi:hypothetical protein